MKQFKKETLSFKVSSLLTFCLLIMCIISFGLTTTSVAAEPQRGGTIYARFAAEPRTLDPHMVTTTEEDGLLCNLYNRLMRWNKDMSKLEPDLVESLSRPDDRTLVIKLRKGVHFHNVPPVNGRELTSEDVKYSIERAAGMHGKKQRFMARSRFEGKIESITTPDKYTVIFKTKEPYAPFLRYASASAIVAREAVDKFGDLGRRAIGTGPFILKDYLKGSHLTLVRNPNYFKKGLPYLDKIIFKFIPSSAANMSAFLAGKIDNTQVYFFQLATIEKEAPTATVVKQKGNLTWVLRVPPVTDTHPLKPPFDSKKVRQAISMAIDKAKLLKVAWGGYGTVQVGSIPNRPPYSLPASDQVEYNPEKARKYLAEAGYPNGFTTELLTWNQPYMTKPAQVAKEMLKEVGINAEIKALPMAQYFTRVYKYDYDMSLHIMACSDDPDHGLTPTFGRNSTYYKWKNEEIWDLIENESKTMDPKKRVAVIREVQRKLVDDAPVTFLYTTNIFTAFQPRVFPKDTYLNPFQMFLFEQTWLTKK
ncbi:MAG: hypothetical protein JRI54_01225 [Deltaproteobacteria bacterium]|nr:hypothetical protein [Deltaproteobacteria bacterium]